MRSIIAHSSKTRIALLAALGSGLFFVRNALAVDTGLEATANSAGLQTGNVDLAVTVGQFINVLLGLIGVIFFVLMIYAGFLWMTAAGNEEKVAKAKKLITSAVIGIIIIFMAYAITSFVIQNVAESSGTGPGAQAP